jgi:hypothetical protein
MSRIFISHSSANNAEAIALRDWMAEQGWADVFLDLDPERGLVAGVRWQAALKAAVDRCELVIFVVSPEWAASSWCKAEFLLSKHGARPKAILPVIVAPTPRSALPSEMTSEYQLVDLTTGERTVNISVRLAPDNQTASVAFSEEGMRRLKIGIQRARIDASYFQWPPADDPQRAPYPGLRPLEADDAGIFFGREASLIKAIDQLRALHEAAPPRVFVILGASGAGKSSFLRAGLFPRLAREDHTFLPLPIIRPERAALFGETGLLASLASAFKAAGLKIPRAELRTAIQDGPHKLRLLFQALVDKTARLQTEGEAKPKLPTVVLSIDQGEELFLAEGLEEAQSLLTLLRDLVMSDQPAIIAVFAIRTDNYERLQDSKALQGLRQETFNLPSMPKGSYIEVINNPVRRLEGTPRAIGIEPRLVQELLLDVEMGEAKDALPLLAFILRWLYDDFHAGGTLTLQHYEQLGRINGAIKAAVESALTAADEDLTIPRDRTIRLALLRRGLIPWLATIDPDTGNSRRRVARLSEIPAEARPLIDQLVALRLLTTDIATDTKEKIIEPAHEALLRHWDLLQDWLGQDAAMMAMIASVRRAAHNWKVKGKVASSLSHSPDSLLSVNWPGRPDLTGILDQIDWEYLEACRKSGGWKTQSLSWHRRLLEVATSVCHLRFRKSGKAFGVGFLVRGKDLAPGLGNDLYVLTCSHNVRNNQTSEERISAGIPFGRPLAEDVVISFEASTRHWDCEVLWQTFPDGTNATLLRIKGEPPQINPVRIASSIPYLSRSAGSTAYGNCPITLIGTSGYNALMIASGEFVGSSTKGHFNDVNDKTDYLFYRAKTKAPNETEIAVFQKPSRGSILYSFLSGQDSFYGGPVFDENIQVIGVHHFSHGYPMGNMQSPAGIDAKEGVSIISISNELKLVFP